MLGSTQGFTVYDAKKQSAQALWQRQVFPCDSTGVDDGSERGIKRYCMLRNSNVMAFVDGNAKAKQFKIIMFWDD